MPTLIAALMSLAGPFVLRILTVLGISILTFTGVSAGLTSLIGIAQSNWSGISADILGLASLAGVPQALGIIAGAMSGRVAAWVAMSATKWITAA